MAWKRCNACDGSGRQGGNLIGDETKPWINCTFCGGKGKVEVTMPRSDCFPSGTLIKTPNGPRPIESIRAGEIVTTWSERRQRWSVGAVLCRKHHKNSELLALVLDCGLEISVTAAHSVLTNRGWVRVCSLRAQDLVSTSSGFHQFVGFRNEGSGFDTYNLIVEGDNSFVANDLVVHSFTYFRVLRGAFWNARAKIFRSTGSLTFGPGENRIVSKRI